MARDIPVDAFEPRWAADAQRLWASPEQKVSVGESRRTGDWVRSDVALNVSKLRALEWTIECTLAGTDLLRGCVTVDADVRGGRAVLIGTGFTVAQLLAELADSSGPEEVAGNFDLKVELIRQLLNGLSLRFETSWTRRP